jgi:hypothetical protein
MSESLITCKEVLKMLHLKTPAYVGYLVERNLLPRYELGPRKYMYDINDVEKLLEMVKNNGVILTIKPEKK